jgi:hypothetical protein
MAVDDRRARRSCRLRLCDFTPVFRSSSWLAALALEAGIAVALIERDTLVRHGAARRGLPMSDRRRANRFMLTESDATLRVMQDVYVEEANATQITIVTDAPPAAGDDLLIELPPEADGRPVLRVRASACTLVRCGDGLRHRVVLQVLQRRTASIVARVGVTR